MRRTIVAFILGAVLFGAPVALAKPIRALTSTPTLAQVLASGNVVPDDGSIIGPNGSSVSFAADGTLVLSTGDSGQVQLLPDGSLTLTGTIGGRVGINADGSVEVAGASGGSVYLFPDGTVQISAAGGRSLYFSPDGNLELNADGFWLSLPATDPGVAGFLWNDAGTVKVSAG